MPCILRASFKSQKAMEAFLLTSCLTPVKVHRKGERRFPNLKRNLKVNKSNSANFDVSRAKFSDLSKQIRDAIRFIKKHELELQRLASLSTKQPPCLDFGLIRRDVPVQCDQLPTELLREMSKVGLALEMSYYDMSTD